MGDARAQQDVLVFAAASLQNALDDVNAAWSEESGRTASISYAASSALARQIESGAPADIFISADLDWMSYLSERDLIDTASERQLLGNRLVLIAPADGAQEVELAEGFDLAGLLEGGRLAMGNVESVPAGRYGRQALESLGLWASVEGSIAQAENVRAAMALVSLGEAPLGIVYQTDAVADENVATIGVFPENSHAPIVYPVALTAESDNPDAVAFMEFLLTPEATALFEAQGFTALATDAD